MEPLSVLGVASAAVQFLDFTGKVVAGTYEIYTGKRDGKTATLEEVTVSLVRVTEQLRQTMNCADPDTLPQHDQDILQLGTACRSLGTRLLSSLEKIQRSPERRASVFSSFKAALLTIWKQSEIDTLSQELERHRSQINLLILASLRQAFRSPCRRIHTDIHIPQ